MSIESPLQGTWVVTAYRSGDEMVEPDRRTEAGLVVEGTRIAGSMGVNRFSGQIDDEIPIGPLATTRMAGPAELMKQEDTLLEILQSADTVEVAGEGMFLSSEGLLLMELERTGGADSVQDF